MGIEREERRVLAHEVETDLPLSFLGFFREVSLHHHSFHRRGFVQDGGRDEVSVFE